MLPHDVARCAGRKPYTADRCPRRTDCARYLAKGGPQSPFYLSVCEQGDSFIHADSLKADEPAAHPAVTSPAGVLAVQPAAQGER